MRPRDSNSIAIDARARDSDDRRFVPDDVAEGGGHRLRQAIHAAGDLVQLAR